MGKNGAGTWFLEVVGMIIYANADKSEIRLQDLKTKEQAENARQKKMYAELSLHHEILSEGYEMLKKYQVQDARKK